MAKSWNLNPVSGDYVMRSNGTPEETDSLTVPAYIRLKTGRQKWLYAPDTSYGSELHEIKKRHTSQDPSNLEAVAVRALQPLVDDGRADQIDIEAKTSYRNAAGLQINITDAQGEPQTLNLDRIGI